MGTRDLLASALKLDPAERFALVDEILHSLDNPDPHIDSLWIEEAQRRLDAFRRGEVKGIAAEDVVGDLSGTDLIVVRNGVIEHIKPEVLEAMLQAHEPHPPYGEQP